MISDKWRECSAERYLELYELGNAFPYHDGSNFLVEAPDETRLCARTRRQAYAYKGCAKRNGVHYETLASMTVAEFAASLKYDLPERRPPGMLCASELRERGWTQDLIVDFLGEPDSRHVSLVDDGFPTQWYEEARVRDAEATHEWSMMQYQMARRRGEIKVPILEEKPVLRYAAISKIDFTGPDGALLVLVGTYQTADAAFRAVEQHASKSSVEADYDVLDLATGHVHILPWETTERIDEANSRVRDTAGAA